MVVPCKNCWLKCCFLLLLVALCHWSAAQSPYSLFHYFEADSLSRPGYESIKIQTTQTSSFKGRDNIRISTIESFYDRSGRLIEEEISNNTTSTVIRTTFTYDSISGFLIYVLGINEKMRCEAFAKYDEQGRLSEIVQCQENKPCLVWQYVYDEDNTERLYVPKQSIGFEFNKNNKPGSIFGISAVDKQKSVLTRERFFNPEGRLEEVRVYEQDTILFGRLYEYDMEGRKTKIWVYNSALKKLSNEYVYDEKGRLQAETTYLLASGSLISVIEPQTVRFEYDDQNRLVKTEENDRRYSKIKEYTYIEY